MAKGTCSTCGLPSELCVCEEVVKDVQELTISVEERRFDKCVTLISGLDPADVDIESLSSELKSSLGCGGTIHEDGTIELQGDHRNRVLSEIEERGYEVREEEG